MGLLIAGNTIGGLAGRLVASAVADVAGWRIGLLAVGLLSLACTAAFRLLLPPPVAPAAPPVRLRALGGQVVRHLRDPGLACLFGLAFVLMGAFVTVYNYLGFRLLDAAVRPPARPRGADLPRLPRGLVGVDHRGAARRPVRPPHACCGSAWSSRSRGSR